MKIKMLALLLWSAITAQHIQAMPQQHNRDEVLMQNYLRSISNNGRDEQAERFFAERVENSKFQQITSRLRFPLALISNFVKEKNRKVGYCLSAFANAVRLIDNSLSMYNYGPNKYNVFFTGYDLARCVKDLMTAFTADKAEIAVEPEAGAAKKIISVSRKIIFPFFESACSYCASLPQFPNKMQGFYQSMSAFAQLGSDYLDSPANSIEAKVLIACLIVNIFCARSDIIGTIEWWTELETRAHQQQGNQVLNFGVQHQEGDLDEDVVRRIEREQEHAEEERNRRLRPNNNHNQGLAHTHISTIQNELINGTIQRDDQCVICNNEWERPEGEDGELWNGGELGINVSVTDCGQNAHHYYHAQCLNRWANQRRNNLQSVNCPTCNFVLEPR